MGFYVQANQLSVMGFVWNSTVYVTDITNINLSWPVFSIVMETRLNSKSS